MATLIQHLLVWLKTLETHSMWFQTQSYNSDRPCTVPRGHFSTIVVQCLVNSTTWYMCMCMCKGHVQTAYYKCGKVPYPVKWYSGFMLNIHILCFSTAVLLSVFRWWMWLCVFIIYLQSDFSHYLFPVWWLYWNCMLEILEKCSCAICPIAQLV